MKVVFCSFCRIYKYCFFVAVIILLFVMTSVLLCHILYRRKCRRQYDISLEVRQLRSKHNVQSFVQNAVEYFVILSFDAVHCCNRGEHGDAPTPFWSVTEIIEIRGIMPSISCDLHFWVRTYCMTVHAGRGSILNDTNLKSKKAGTAGTRPLRLGIRRDAPPIGRLRLGRLKTYVHLQFTRSIKIRPILAGQPTDCNATIHN